MPSSERGVEQSVCELQDTMIKRFLHSDFVAHYGSIFVLLLLCAYYRYVTYGEQHPISPVAGIDLAKRIVQEEPAGGVLIVIRETAGDREFAAAIARELSAHHRAVAGTVSGPAELREFIENAGRNGNQISVIATHQPGTMFGPLREKSLTQFRAKYANLKDLRLFTPISYFCPTFLTQENLVNVIN